jgi:WD40 repeat protein
MSGGKLAVRQAFGLTGPVKNCLTFVEDHHLAYVCGHQIVVINTETREQNFIPGTATYQHQSLGFTAIATCFSKKVIGVAEKVEPSAIVTFYDSHSLRKKKLLTYPELGSNEIRCLAFSEDGRYLLTQGAGPEWNLVLWNVDKAIKILCSTKISISDENAVNQVSFCPWDPTVIVVIGKSLLKFFRFIEGTLRPITFTIRRDSANFISHAWLNDEYLIVGTENGEILLIENFEVRGHISPNRSEQEDLSPILCLHRTSRGFIMGSSGSEIKIFEKRDDVKEKFQLEDSYIIPGNYGNILELSLGLDELLICGMEKHQLLSCSLSSLHSLKDSHSSGGNNASSSHSSGGGKDGHQHHNTIFENVFTPFHYPNSRGDCEITGIDVALWKQIVATCGKDRTLRVWNPTDKRIEIMKEFDDEPIGLSLHPTGIYVAVAFPDKVKLMSILLDEIYLCREINARQISYVKFSRGGQYFAVAIGTNLQIYQTYTGLQIATLRGHNNRIRSVLWMNYDSRIITFGAEGVVNVWELFPLNKRPEHYPGSVPIQCGIGPVDGSIVYVSLNDRQLKELSFIRQEGGLAGAGSTAVNNNSGSTAAGNSNSGGNNNNPTGATISTGSGSNSASVEMVIKATKSIDLSYTVSTMLFDENRRLLLMGTVNEGPCGIAVTMTSPSLGGGTIGSNAPPLVDLNLFHSGPVTALCQSYDGMTIYSADSHGCICISEFEGYNSGNNASSTSLTPKSPVKQREGIVAFEFVEEVVIHKQDLQNRQNQILSLTQSVEELNKNNEHQLRLKDIKQKDKITDIFKTLKQKFKAYKIKYGELETEKVNIEKEFSKKVKTLEEKQIDELNNLEKKYKNKYNAEENRHKLLMEETSEAHKKWIEENELLILSHQKYLQELTEDYEFKLTQEQKQQKEIQKDKESLQINYEFMKNETENDGDREVAEMKIRYTLIFFFKWFS